MGGTRGSRIIVTTRSRRVAKITSKCQPYELRGLSGDDAWTLFKEIAFEQRYADSKNLAFVKIGKQILEKCGGLPLVIRTIAGTLSFKETDSEWLSFKDNELARISQREELPKKIEKLVNLTLLPCYACRSLTHRPRGIRKLTSLQTLSMFVVDKDGSHCAATADLMRMKRASPNQQSTTRSTADFDVRFLAQDSTGNYVVPTTSRV
ncbi:hypothetical protein V6N11_078915 [Hibiscus sabdariffa]|uniref:NB-ARC domain-containing protein n=1 Tax=Hibiscus sabdariffa TaxID=183260 RepID=A0ABR2RU67_9ROSI